MYTRLGLTAGRTSRESAASKSTSPFLDAEQRAEQPDRDRDRLVAAMQAAPPPFGEVLGAVGYHYEQWAQLSAYAQGIGVRTRHNPDFTMLDDEQLRPMWSVAVRTPKSTYDASDRSYLVATLPAGAAPDLVRLSAETGRRKWCATLEGPGVQGDDPFATQILPDEGVAVLGPGEGDEERLVRLSGEDGEQVWARNLDADSGDFLGDMGDETLLVGGREQFRLFDPESLSNRPEGPALVLVSAKDGDDHLDETSSRRLRRARPRHRPGDPQGIRPGDRRGRADPTDRAGREGRRGLVEDARPGDHVRRDPAVRADPRARGQPVVGVRRGGGAAAVDPAVPERPQFLPYGFELDSVPLLDADHALIGGTTALHTLDLRNGTMTSARLPTDGISTTYWPYEVVVSPGLIGVATNTGAVVVRRE